jgi:hypothetical protein
MPAYSILIKFGTHMKVAVVMKAAILCDILPCSPYVNRRLERSSETSVHTRTTWRYIQEDGKIHNYRCENLRSYTRVVTSEVFKLLISYTKP